MRDTLPRKPTAAVAEIKKGLKDSLYGNGMSSGSPTPSGGSSSPAQDISEGAQNCIPPVMPKPPTPSVTAGAVASPLSSPGIRVKSSPKHKLRRNQSMDSKHKNPLFDFDGQIENNFCNNNNSKLTRRHSSKPDDHTSRTPSRNSVSDELSSSSLTPTTDDQTNSGGGQNLELNAIFDNVDDVDDEMLHKVLKGIEKGPNDSLGLSEGALEFDVSSFQNSSDALLYENNPLRTSQPELPPLEGLSNSPSSPQQYMSTVSANSTSVRGIPQAAMASSTSSPSSATKFSPPSSSDSTNSKMGKSHLQDILGVTDTIRLKNMSRPIDTVPYKSPTTTTSYSMTGMKPTPNTPSTPSTMAPPNRLPSNVPFSNKPPRQPYMFSPDQPMYRPSSQQFMDNGANGPWSRGSPRHVPPNLMKSPQFSGPYVESSMSPSLVNPMSGLQNTVDSIPAVGTSEPGTPVMGPPLRSPHGFETATPSPGGGRMRPPPSPSVVNDKRCVSADSVTVGSNGKKAGNKRERTRSADSKEEDKKETSGPKNKRRKSRSKDENITGKKESKTPGRSSKEDKFPRQDSALSGLLDVQTSNPYIYIFNTDTANKAASTVRSSEVPDIILFHQSFLGNCKLRPSEHFKPRTTSSEQPRLSDTPCMSMPTTCRSPTEMPAVKSEMALQKSPRISPQQGNPENIQAINLQDTKPMLLPAPDIKTDPINEPVSSQPVVTSQNGVQQQQQQQEELSAEKRRKREDKLEKLRKMQGMFLKDNQENPNIGNNNPMPRGPVWPSGHPPHHPGQMAYGSMPMDDRPPGMKEMPMPSDVMMPPGGHPMSQESAEWQQLIQKHNAEKRRQQEVGMRGDLPTRPPPPYGMNGPQTRWLGPERYPVDARMPIDPMNHARLQRMGPGHRQLVRMHQDPRISGGYIPPRMGIPRGPYPPNQQQRMSVYEPYMGPPGMRHPSRLPHPGHTAHPAMRQSSENFPFSEQLMKQASFYSGNMPPYDNEPQMGPEWAGPEGPQRLSHMPGSTSPAIGPQSMINPMEMNPRITPALPNRGYEPHMPSYNPEMGQRYDVIPMGSPTGPMDPRMRGPSGTSMMDAIARRGAQRPPDLNLNNQLPPRSPMNYHGQGPMPSPSVNAMSQPVRYPNPSDMGHPPQPSPMHARSPQMVMGQPPLPVGPSSAGVEAQSVMMGPGPQMSGGPPHSAGPLSNPPNDWPGHNLPPGTPTPNSSMMHPSNMMQPSGMTSQPAMVQPGMMSSQPGMMSSQPGMIAGMQQPQPGGMMTSPIMMSQPGMMTSQSQVIHRVPHTPSTKPTQNVLSIMKESLSSFKMPGKTPIYQDAVKDTATPPPMNHQNDVVHMPHNPMPGGMRMPVPNHPQSVPYDARMVPPRMCAQHHMNENFQPGYPGGGHPSPMSGPTMAGHAGNGMNGMVMNMGGHEHMGHPPNDYQQPRPNFPEMPEFDLRNILPSERPSQTISYLPPEGNSDQFHSPGPGWVNEGIRPQPQLMPGPAHPASRPPML